MQDTNYTYKCTMFVFPSLGTYFYGNRNFQYTMSIGNHSGKTIVKNIFKLCIDKEACVLIVESCVYPCMRRIYVQ